MATAKVLSEGGRWGRIFILDFALISRTFPLDTKLKEQPASSSSEEIFSSPPWGFLTEIYLFCENWSTDTFRLAGICVLVLWGQVWILFPIGNYELLYVTPYFRISEPFFRRLNELSHILFRVPRADVDKHCTPRTCSGSDSCCIVGRHVSLRLCFLVMFG